MTIPNRISLAMVAAFRSAGAVGGPGARDMAYHAGAGLLVLAVGVLLFIPGWIGGGDAKLAAAVALWLGFENLFSYLFCVALAGGSLALLFMSVRAHPLPAFVCAQPWAVRLHDRRAASPMALPSRPAPSSSIRTTSWFASLIG